MSAPEALAALSESERAYLEELAADIASHGGPGEDMVEAVKVAHARRQAFAMEMAEGKTDRAQMARKVLLAKVYGECAARGAIETALEHCGHIHEGTWRRQVFGG